MLAPLSLPPSLTACITSDDPFSLRENAGLKTAYDFIQRHRLFFLPKFFFLLVSFFFFPSVAGLFCFVANVTHLFYIFFSECDSMAPFLVEKQLPSPPTNWSYFFFKTSLVAPHDHLPRKASPNMMSDSKENCSPFSKDAPHFHGVFFMWPPSDLSNYCQISFLSNHNTGPFIVLRSFDQCMSFLIG